MNTSSPTVIPRKAEYFIVKEFRNDKGIMNEVRIKLTIYHDKKTYDIEPSNGGDSFRFKASSHLWSMWKAVASAIQQAVDFANEELGIEKEGIN